MQTSWIAVFGFIAIGVGMTVAGIATTFYTLNWMKQTVITQGTVLRLVCTPAKDSDDSDSYAPEVQFTTPDGISHSFVSSVGTGNRSSFRPGDQVEIRYDPAKPQSAAINRWIYLFLLPIILATLGLIFTVIGLAALWQKKKTGG